MQPNLTDLLDAAFTYHQAGDLVEANRRYREILLHYPAQPDTLHMMGIIAKQQGNNELALKLIEIALGQKTTMPLAWHNRALLLRIMGRKEESLQSAEQAIALDQNFADAWDLAGFLSRDKKDFQRSLACHARAVTLQPDNLKFLGNYALLLLATGDLVNAYKIMRGIEKKDANFLTHTTGNILKASGHADMALPYFRKSCALLPDNEEVRVTVAMALLQAGKFMEGWALWETRPSLGPRYHDIPLWKSGAVAHLLVHEDQGMGDAFQCARYIPRLKQFAKHITISVTPALKKVFEFSFPDFVVQSHDDPAPVADARVRMLSLPAIFGATADNIPAPIPYMKARDEWRAAWTNRLEKTAKPRIGVVWGGNPDHLNDSLRSISNILIQPLLNAAPDHMISLQKGIQRNGIDLATAGVFDADVYLNDFSETAGLLEEIDLLISVDTSVVHLAGAMGKPVWLLLPFDPDWRWLIGREDSPWYPSMRLYRQHKPRDWTGVIERVTMDVLSFVNGDTSVLQPKKWTGGSVERNPFAIDLPQS